MLALQLPQLQIEDVASVLQLAKTADIKASDALAVATVLERVEIAISFAKLQRAQPAQPAEAAPPAAPADKKP